MENIKLKALFIIVNAGYTDEVIEIARETGVRGATIIHSRGEGARHESFWGITVNDEKEMILCVVDEESALRTMDVLKEKAGIETPAHSICFSMPVDKMVGISLPTPPETEK